MLRAFPFLGLFILAAASAPAAGEELDRAQVETIIREYLLENPEVIMEAVGVLQERAEKAAFEKNRKAITDHRDALFNDPLSIVIGNPKGDVTLVEFYDYRCPYCREMHARVERLIAGDPNLRVVLKQYPVKDYPGEAPVSLVAARLAQAAHKQGKFAAFHGALFAAEPPLSEERLYALAAEAGLDVTRLKEDMRAPETAQHVRETLLLADALGINGTPTFVVGDIILPGVIETDVLVQLIARARSLQAAGAKAQNP
ncbi:MAG TPA: DsbA family protein [Sphingomonadales bacterium]|nr:DsbA family protein [Sphingomonadales bacterium]